MMWRRESSLTDVQIFPIGTAGYFRFEADPHRVMSRDGDLDESLEHEDELAADG